MFRQNFTCSALLNTSNHASYTGLSPISPSFPTGSSHIHCSAGPGSLATTTGVSIDFLSSGYLDVSVPQVRLIHLWIQCMIPAISGWVSPFRNLRIKVCLPTPRSLSQAPTSFIASNCQGIHRMRLIAWPYKTNDCIYEKLSFDNFLPNLCIQEYTRLKITINN